MNLTDSQYCNIIKDIKDEGEWQENRTSMRAKFIPSSVITSDLRHGFPCLTTKRVPTKSCFGEILSFIRGYTNAEDFRKNGCRIWDQNANENEQWLNNPLRKGKDDLGRIYGAIWRSRKQYVNPHTFRERIEYTNLGYKEVMYECDFLEKEVDQLYDVIDSIKNKPQSRRIIMHAWFPEEFDAAALPPCHVLYDFVPDVSNKILHMTMMQRSCDLLLGVPFNHAGSAFLLSIISKACGYTPGVFSHHMTNVHLYENQLGSADVQLDNESYSLPTLIFKTEPETDSVLSALNWMEELSHDDYDLQNYQNAGKLPHVRMAV